MPVRYIDAGPAEGVRANPYISQYVPMPYKELLAMKGMQQRAKNKLDDTALQVKDYMAKLEYDPHHAQEAQKILGSFNNDYQTILQSAVNDPSTTNTAKLRGDLLGLTTGVTSSSDWLNIAKTEEQHKLNTTEADALKSAGTYRPWNDPYVAWGDYVDKNGIRDKKTGQIIPFTHTPIRAAREYRPEQVEAIGGIAKEGYSKDLTPEYVQGVLFEGSEGAVGIDSDKLWRVVKQTGNSLFDSSPNQLDWFLDKIGPINPELAYRIGQSNIQTLGQLPNDVIAAGGLSIPSSDGKKMIPITNQAQLKNLFDLDLYSEGYKQIGVTTKKTKDVDIPEDFGMGIDVEQMDLENRGLASYSVDLNPGMEADFKNWIGKTYDFIEGTYKATGKYVLPASMNNIPVIGGIVPAGFLSAGAEELGKKVTTFLDNMFGTNQKNQTSLMEKPPDYIGAGSDLAGATWLWDNMLKSKQLEDGKVWYDKDDATAGMTLDQQKDFNKQFQGHYTDMVNGYYGNAKNFIIHPIKTLVSNTQNELQAGQKAGEAIAQNIIGRQVKINYFNGEELVTDLGYDNKFVEDYGEVIPDKSYVTGYADIYNPFGPSTAAVNLAYSKDGGKTINYLPVYAENLDINTTMQFRDDHALQMSLWNIEEIGKPVKMIGAGGFEGYAKVQPIENADWSYTEGKPNEEVINPYNYTVWVSDKENGTYIDTGKPVKQYLHELGADKLSSLLKGSALPVFPKMKK